MSGRIRLDRGELPWAPLVPGGEGLNRYPEEPVALRARMAEVYGVAAESVFACRGNGFAHEFINIALPGINLVDERLFEIEDWPSQAREIATRSDAWLLRDLDAYGLAGAPCSAVITSPGNVLKLQAALPLHARLDTPTQRLALAALDPSRLQATEARWALIRAERDRMQSALGLDPRHNLIVALTVPNAHPDRMRAFGIEVDWENPTTARIAIGTPEQNDLVLAAMGVAVPATSHRTATIARDTKETRIVASVDLDRPGTRQVHTGIGFFDHMLDQVAAHGGFGLTLAVEGDLHIDPHHSIEDATLALGAALKQALGDRAGIGRYGFVLPMDEAEARISLDLGGRPFSIFDGSFHASHIGAYPTALTAHVFRSLAESMGAAIHVHVSGEDDHHKTEACFKALGRALRQAIRVEGDDVPSTKGVL